MIFCLSTFCAIGFDFRDVLWKRFNKKEAKRHDTMALPYLQLSLVTWSSLGAAKMATTEQPRSRTRFGTYLALRCCQASLPSDNPSEFNIPLFHCLEIQQISRLSVFVTHKLFFRLFGIYLIYPNGLCLTCFTILCRKQRMWFARLIYPSALTEITPCDDCAVAIHFDCWWSPSSNIFWC